MKILYIDDQGTDSLKLDLEKYGFDVETSDAGEFNSTLAKINEDFDAYVMDFELSACGTGMVDAPTYASTIRTFGQNHKDSPIVLISSDQKIHQFKQDFSSLDLFDKIITKEEFCQKLSKYSKQIEALVNAYKTIKNTDFDICKMLEMDAGETIDFRLQNLISSFKNNQDVYGCSRIILETVVRSVGMLVGQELIAARFGIDKTCDDFGSFLEYIGKYKYKGLFSSAYERWWWNGVMVFWNDISEKQSLRRLDATERVTILNSKLGLKLVPATPIKNNFSSYFWTYCKGSLLPLDPSEGYVFMQKELKPWQEEEYISLDYALETPSIRKYLTPTARKEILAYGKK